jgi:hypothetical protein
MFHHIEIHLSDPLCGHRPTSENKTWRWFATVRPGDNRRNFDIHIHCTVCQKQIIVPYKKVCAAFFIDGRPAIEQPALPSPTGKEPAPQPAQNAQAIVHEKRFTPYDRDLCKKMGIVFEGE